MAVLIEQKKPANRLARQVNWLDFFGHKSPVRDIFEQTAVFNNVFIIKYLNILTLKEHLSFNFVISPESGLRYISIQNK